MQESSITLIQENKFDQLAKLLGPEEFQPLCPLILLVGWEHCANIEAAKVLVSTLSSFVVCLKFICDHSFICNIGFSIFSINACLKHRNGENIHANIFELTTDEWYTFSKLYEPF